MAANRPGVPEIPTRLLIWYCGEHEAEDLLGDLEENFIINLSKTNRFRASLKYWSQTVGLLFSYAVRQRKASSKTDRTSKLNLPLLSNFIKLSFRNLMRQKTFSIINLTCLAVGMSVGMMALAAFMDVLETDDFISNKDHIYRIITRVDNKEEKATFASSSAPLGFQLLMEGTGIDQLVQLKRDFSMAVETPSRIEIPIRGYYASDNFFNVFDFKFLEGNPGQALKKPFAIVITQPLAEKLFNKQDPIGQTIPVAGVGEFEVTGIIEDYPRSHFYFEAIVSFQTLNSMERRTPSGQLDDWGPRTEFYNYLLLPPGQRPEDIKSSLNEILSRHFMNQNELIVECDLQALNDIPFTEYYNEIGLSWGYQSFGVFFALAMLVLIPACFNYSNISIARSLHRAKEIGLRKVVGGGAGNVFIQVITETVVLSLLALGGGILILILVRDQFISMVYGGIKTFDLEITPYTFLSFLILAIVTGLVAGFFPATYFSRLNPIETLRNSSRTGKLSKINIRRGLIVFQFALSLSFILGVVIVARQYFYGLHYERGFRQDRILEFPLMGVDQELLKTEMEKLAEVGHVSFSSNTPGMGGYETFVKSSPGQDADSLLVDQMFVNRDFLSSLDIPLIAGKPFPERAAHDEEYLIVNETFFKKMGIPSAEMALNKVVQVDDKALRIIGVVKDFNYAPLRLPIRSFIFRSDPTQFTLADIDILSDDLAGALAQIESVWDRVAPDIKFQSYLLSDRIEESMQSFQQMFKMFLFLSLLAITISCLGLFAVMTSAADGRIREMGVRKVMGATPSQLALAISRGFIKLILIAIGIASPFCYIFYEKIFLSMQYYHARVGWLDLASGIGLLMILVVLTMGGQVVKVAHVDPVKTLKAE